MAVISEPRLLLLDEPTCGMSPAETERAVDKIRELARTIDIIIIEHDMEVVFGIADDITVMAQGAILASGGPKEIAADERVREAYLGRRRGRGLRRGSRPCLGSTTCTSISANCISCRASTWR